MRKNNIYNTAYDTASTIEGLKVPMLEGLKSSTLTTSKLAELHSQYLQAQNKRTLARSLYDQVMNGRVNELPDVFADQKIIELQKLLNEKTAEAAELSVKFGARNPKMIEINNQVDVLIQQYKKSLDQLAKKIPYRL